MRKTRFIIVLLLILLNPLNIFAKGNVNVESIEQIEKSSGVTEKTKATIENNKIILDLEMSDVNDFAKYKVTINNSSNGKYRVVANIDNSKIDYIKYKIDFEDDNTVLDINSKKVFYITATYEEQVPFSLVLDDGVYKKTTNLDIKFDNNEFIDNPLTFSNIIFLILIITVLGLFLILIIFKKKTRPYLMIILFTISYVLPFNVLGLNTYKIEVETSIEVDLLDTFLIDNNDGNGLVSYRYYKGMSAYDFIEMYPEQNAFPGIFSSKCHGYSYENNKFPGCIEETGDYELCNEKYPSSYYYGSDNFMLMSSENGSYHYYSCCLSGDMEVEVLDSKTKKRRKKKLKDVTYDDLILVWNFDKGCYEWAKPFWIMKPEEVPYYYILKFSDDSFLEVIGDHNIYSVDDNKFVSAIEASIGMKTINSKGEIITLISREKVDKPTKAYNVITSKHINIFANGLLTSWSINNLYEIKDMKYIKNNKDLNTIEDIGDIPEEYFEELRFAELSIKETKEETCKYIKDKVDYLISKKM